MEDINGHRKLISQEWKNLPKGFCIYSTHDGGSIQRVISDHDEMQSIFERVLTAYKQETEPAVLVPKTPTVATATATPQYRRSSRRNRRRGGGDSPTEPLLSLPYKYGSGLDWDPIYMCWKPKPKKESGNRKRKSTPSSHVASVAMANDCQSTSLNEGVDESLANETSSSGTANALDDVSVPTKTTVAMMGRSQSPLTTTTFEAPLVGGRDTTTTSIADYVEMKSNHDSDCYEHSYKPMEPQNKRVKQ